MIALDVEVNAGVLQITKIQLWCRFNRFNIILLFLFAKSKVSLKEKFSIEKMCLCYGLHALVV